MRKIRSRLLLILQLLAIGYIMIFGGIFTKNLLFQFIQLTGIILGLWAIYYLFKFSKFNAFAELKKNSSLVIRGPYKFVRNPIYLAVILYTLPLAIETYEFNIMWAFIVLIIVLLLKIDLEESYLVEKFDNYIEYKKKTWKLIPFIY